jgi:hypothetical protein
LVVKKRLRKAAQRAARNPVLRQNARSMKPTPTLWGIAGVLLFFILPEIIAFWRGHEIALWAHAHYLEEPDRILRLNYWLLEKIFEEGGSWLNLGIGVALLAWIGYEWRQKGSQEREEDS